MKSRCLKKSCAAARRQHVMGQGAWRLEADAGVVSGLPDSARCADEPLREKVSSLRNAPDKILLKH